MAVIPLTLAISLCLAFTFILFFLREHARGQLSSMERDSLLPLAEESSFPAKRPASSLPTAASSETECTSSKS